MLKFGGFEECRLLSIDSNGDMFVPEISLSLLNSCSPWSDWTDQNSVDNDSNGEIGKDHSESPSSSTETIRVTLITSGVSYVFQTLTP